MSIGVESNVEEYNGEHKICKRCGGQNIALEE